MIHNILTKITASISDLKKNPMYVVGQGEGSPVAILNRNKPVFYCVPAGDYEAMMEKLEDAKLNNIADSRKGQKRIRININDL